MRVRSISLQLLKRTGLVLAVLSVCLTVSGVFRADTYSFSLGERRVTLSNSAAGATATYNLELVLSSTDTTGSIRIEFCDNDPLPTRPCTAPPGFDASNAVLASQSGETGFSINSSSTANRIVLSRTPSLANADTRLRYVFNNIVNPSNSGSLYVRLLTYPTSDASGPSIDYGGIALVILNPLSVTAEVPPFLIFCAATTIPNLLCEEAEGNYIDFGELSSTQPRTGTSQLLTATNSGSGYTITLAGNTMVSGANPITAVIAPDVSRPGTAQFGLNLRSNSAPTVGAEPSGPGVAPVTPDYAQQNRFRFVAGDTVVGTTVPDNFRKHTVSYLVNVPSNQPAGVYASTVTYVCLANF